MAGEDDKKEPEESPFVIHLATFSKGYPFETRKGAFHSYTYLPFLGWLDPITLNLILFVLGIVLVVAVPAVANAVRRSRGERATLERLAALRESMALFHRETTWTPIPPEALVRAGRLSSVPKTDLVPYHSPSDAVLEAAAPDDAGGWRFDRSARDPGLTVTVNCTHTDHRGKPWSSY